MKCPYCEKLLTAVAVRSLVGTHSIGEPWRCVAYGCPHCLKAISIGMDPKAFRNDTVDRTVKRLSEAGASVSSSKTE